MPRGSNTKREREYKELESEFKKEGRYKGREEEVAARIVNKQRSRFGETKAEKKKDRKGKSPDRDLPVKQYQHKTIDQVKRAIKKLSQSELKEIERYEKQHKNRKTLLAQIKEQMSQAGNGSKKKTGSASRAKRDRTKSSDGGSRRGGRRSHCQ